MWSWMNSKMNDRIKELAEQAGSTHKQNLGVYQFYTDELEKFAELIVRECAGEIRKQGDGESLDDWDRGYEAGLISAINALHKHFGVENGLHSPKNN
jgi:hypothetical protein